MSMTMSKAGTVEVEVVLRVRVDAAEWARDRGTDLAGVPASVREHFTEHADTSRAVRYSRGAVVVL